MAPIVPPGTVGRATVDHFTITGKEFLGFRRDAYIIPGTYARLLVNGETMMSDTQMEQRTNADALRAAHGDVLIAGLGLGMLLYPLLRKPEVRSVRVLEVSPDVIALIIPHLAHPKLVIEQTDARTWTAPKGATFNTIWLDIWGCCSTDELDDMRTLRRRYRKWLVKGGTGWLDSWWWDELRERYREEQRWGGYY
jgi:spermidine synthase